MNSTMSGTKTITRPSKRKDESQSGPSAKKPNRRESVNSEEDSGPLKIIDVDDDCLEHVFFYLNATDLNNVADAHPHLVPSARMVFKQKYSDKLVEIRDSGRVLLIWNSSESNRIVEATVKSFLTNFGKLISKLRVDYKNDSKFKDAHHWREIEGIIFEYCTKTLKEIYLVNCRGNVMEDILSPFEKVEKLQVEYGFTEPTKVDLNNWFPNICRLNVIGSAVRSSECLKGCNRCLKYVDFKILKVEAIVAEINIQNFIQSNPHIVRLIIDSYINYRAEVNVDLLKSLSENLTQLQTLYLINLKFKESDSIERIHFPNVDNLLLESVDCPNNTLITFGQLKTLDIWRAPSNIKWIDFIVQNKNVNSLVCGIERRSLNIGDLIQIVTELPDLNTLRFWSSSFRCDDFIQLLKVCEPMQNLKIIGRIYTNSISMKNEITKIENVMNGELRTAFDCPIAQPFKDEFLILTNSQSIDICRKIN